MKWYSKYYEQWHLKFALLPKRCNTGHIVWLEKYYTKYGRRKDTGSWTFLKVPISEILEYDSSLKEIP